MPIGVYAREPAHRRFLSKVKQTKKCWTWTGAVGTHGYGRFGLKNKTMQAHRFSYELFNSRVPLGLWVLHMCDNRLCVNPNHLFLGDRKTNIDDCVSKKRHAFGDRHALRKLRTIDIERIRFMYKTGNYTQQRIADIFKTSNGNISMIVNHKSRRLG